MTGPVRTSGPDAAVTRDLLEFLERRTRVPVAADVDLFGSGMVSSLFALELVVHLETAFGIEIAGPELRLDNFRTVAAMTTLVARLRGGGDG
jgi:methoxymalonate biosynthesis acyl carrier protein